MLCAQATTQAACARARARALCLTRGDIRLARALPFGVTRGVETRPVIVAHLLYAPLSLYLHHSLPSAAWRCCSPGRQFCCRACARHGAPAARFLLRFAFRARQRTRLAAHITCVTDGGARRCSSNRHSVAARTFAPADIAWRIRRVSNVPRRPYALRRAT